MDCQVRAVVWLAAFFVISCGGEIQCRFCFKYFLESCDGTYRIEIGNLALSEEDLKFTKHCSNEPFNKGIFGASSATTSEISGNNFPVVSGKVPGQHPDYGIEGLVKTGSQQEINTVPLQQNPSVQPDKYTIHAENKINSEDTIYKLPAENPSYDGEESLDTAVDNIKINIGENTNHQHLSPEGVSPSNDSEGLESTEMYNVIHLKGKKTKRQPQYLENIPSVQYTSVGGKVSEEIGTQHAINVEGENAIYQPQLLNDFNTYQYNSNSGEKIIGTGGYNPKGNGIHSGELLNYGEEHLVEPFKPNQQPSYKSEESFGTGVNNIINLKGEKTVYKPHYPDDFQSNEQPTYDGDGLFVTGLHNVNKVGENTNTQLHHPEGFESNQYSTNDAQKVELYNSISKKSEYIIHQPQYPEGIKSGYGGEKLTGPGIYNVINNEGENTIYQSKYPKDFQLDQYPTYGREGSVETGIVHEINKVGENTNYIQQSNQHPIIDGEGLIEVGNNDRINEEGGITNIHPQNPEVFKVVQQSNYGGDKTVDTGIHAVINSITKDTIYQPQNLGSFKPDNHPSYDREGTVENGLHKVNNIEGENNIYQPQYLKIFKPGQYPNYVGEGSVVNGIHKVINKKVENTYYQPQYPGGYKLGHHPGYGGEGFVGSGMPNIIIPKGESTVYQLQYPETLKYVQNFINGRVDSIDIGKPNVINAEGENTFYRPQYLKGLTSDQHFNYAGEVLKENKLHTAANPEVGHINYQPQYPEYFQTGQQPKQRELDIVTDHAVDREIKHYPERIKSNEQDLKLGSYPSYVTEGIVRTGSQHAINVEGKNTVYQPSYPTSFPSGKFSSYTGARPIENGMYLEINPNSKNTIYQPQFLENSQPGQFITHVREGSVETGTHYVVNNEGENTIYQPQYPGGTKPGQYLSYGKKGIVGTEMNYLGIPKSKETVNYLQYPQYFKTDQYPNNGKEVSMEIGMHKVTNIEGDHTILQSLYPEDFKNSQHSNNVEGLVETEIINLGKPKFPNTVHYPQYPENFQPSFDRESSVEIGSHHVINVDGENTDYEPQLPDSSNPSNVESGKTETSVVHAINIEGDNTIYQPQYAVGLKPTQQLGYTEVVTEINNIRIPEGKNTVNVYHYSQDLQPSQLPSFSGEGLVGIHNDINTSGEHTVYQPAYLHETQPNQQPSNSDIGSVGIEMNNLKNPKDKQIVYESQISEHVGLDSNSAHEVEGSTESEMYNVLNLKEEQTDNNAQHLDYVQPDQHPGNSVVISAGNRIHVLIDSEDKNTIHEPQHSDIFLPNPDFDEIVSVGIEKSNLENLKDKITVDEPQSFENVQPGQTLIHGEEGSVESIIHNELNHNVEQTDNQEQHPVDLQLNHHPSNDVEVSVGDGIHVLIDTEGKNTLHEPQYPKIFLPDSKFGGEVSEVIGDQHAVNVEGENTVYQYPNNGVRGTEGIEGDNVINTEGVNSIYQPQYSDGSQPDQFTGLGGEGSLGIVINNVEHNTGVNTVYKPQYLDGSEPSQQASPELVGSIEAGSQQVINTDVENTVQGLQDFNIAHPVQHPSLDGKETVETGSHQVITTYHVQQPEYPIVIQSDQRPNYDGAGGVEIGTGNVINTEDNNVGYHGENLDVKNIVQPAEFPSVTVVGQLPNFSGEGSEDLNSQLVINAEGQNSIHHPQDPKNLQWVVHPTYGGEGTVEHVVPDNLRVVHSGAQSEYPDHLHEYQNGDVIIKTGGTHTGKNLEYSNGIKPMEQPNDQSGVSSMQVNIHQDGNGHQPTYSIEKQPGQRVEEFSSSVEQSQLGDSPSRPIRTHEFEIEHEQEVDHVLYPAVNSDNNMQSGGHIPGSGNFGSLQQPGYPYLGTKGTSGLYQKVLFEPQDLSGLQPEVNQFDPLIYTSSGMLPGQSMAGNYLFKNPKPTVPVRGVLQYLGMPSLQKVVQHIVHHHVHMPSLAAGLPGMTAIIEKQKLAECIKKYGNVCKQLLKNKHRIPDNVWHKYFKSSYQNPIKDLYVDESLKKKLLYGLYGKQLLHYLKHIPKLEQSTSAESSEQSDENSLNTVQLQALLASKKEEGKYASAFINHYLPQMTKENHQNTPSAELFGIIPNFNSYLKSKNSANQDEMKSLNVLKPAHSTQDKSSSGKVYHKIVKKIRVRTRSKIRGIMARRNNDGNTEDYEDENTTDDPNEIVEYVEEEIIPEDNNEENNKNDDSVESVGNLSVTTEETVAEKHN